MAIDIGVGHIRKRSTKESVQRIYFLQQIQFSHTISLSYGVGPKICAQIFGILSFYLFMQLCEWCGCFMVFFFSFFFIRCGLSYCWPLDELWLWHNIWNRFCSAWNNNVWSKLVLNSFFFSLSLESRTVFAYLAIRIRIRIRTYFFILFFLHSMDRWFHNSKQKTYFFPFNAQSSMCYSSKNHVYCVYVISDFRGALCACDLFPSADIAFDLLKYPFSIVYHAESHHHLK